jgi:2-methylcitrate dehydratase PrpD
MPTTTTTRSWPSATDRVYGLLTHPTAPALPAALAMAEATGASGAQAMLAYHLAWRVECKISEAINPRHYQTGFHSTATCGTSPRRRRHRS